MQDLGGDVRDQIMELEDLIKEARKAKIKYSRYLEEVAAFSSRSRQSVFRRFITE